MPAARPRQHPGWAHLAFRPAGNVAPTHPLKRARELDGEMHNLTVRTRSDIALYLLNHERAHLRALEERFRIAIMVNADATIAGQLSFVIEKGEQVHSLEQAKALALQPATAVPPIEEEEDEGDYEDEEAP